MKRLGIGRDFNFLWLGESVSVTGTQFSALAVPSLAILRLHAGPVEVGVLTGCGFAGYPIAGIIAGPLVDRLPKRRVMLVTNAFRALVLILVAVDAILGTAAIWHLALAALLMSAATAPFDAAYQALLPQVVPPNRILAANARLETSQSVAYFAGPAVGGVVIQLVGAATAIIADALSYAFAFLTVTAVRAERTLSSVGRPSFLSDLREGFQAFRRYSFLGPIVTCVGISNAGNMMVRSLLLLFMYRAVHLSPAVAGWVFAAGGVAGVAGATLAGKVGDQFGLGSALALSTVVEGLAWCLAPLALVAAPGGVLIAAAALSGVMTPIWNVNNVSLRQRAVPLHLQARVVALARVVGVGAIPVGTVLGGLVASLLVQAYGNRIGLTLALMAGALVAASSVIPLLLGNIPRLRMMTHEGAASHQQLG